MGKYVSDCCKVFYTIMGKDFVPYMQTQYICSKCKQLCDKLKTKEDV